MLRFLKRKTPFEFFDRAQFTDSCLFRFIFLQWHLSLTTCTQCGYKTGNCRRFSSQAMAVTNVSQRFRARRNQQITTYYVHIMLATCTETPMYYSRLKYKCDDHTWHFDNSAVAETFVCECISCQLSHTLDCTLHRSCFMFANTAIRLNTILFILNWNYSKFCSRDVIAFGLSDAVFNDNVNGPAWFFSIEFFKMTYSRLFVQRGIKSIRNSRHGLERSGV